MRRGVRWYLVSSVILVALIVLAGCSHYMMAERESWRRDAESDCLNSGAVKESPGRVRISAIDGPGACGMTYPIRVTELGENGPLGYTDDPQLPPAVIPNASMPQHWPLVQSTELPAPAPNAAPIAPSDFTPPPPPGYPPPQAYGPPQTYTPVPPPAPQQPFLRSGQSPYGQAQYGAPLPPPQQVGAPMSLTPPGISAAGADGPPPNIAAPAEPPPYSTEPLGPPRAPLVTASAGPVEVKPAATLACPIVSALDQWINTAVQPAALHWFNQPVVEIKQISAYSCRGMNGNPNAHISEHAFGNALDVAEFTLADGHKVSVQYGWHGSPEEQGFLHDVQSAACDEFTTVLAPGANVYHYNHIHVDLMRRSHGRHICEPSAIPGEVAAARARAQYAARHGEPSVTGSIGGKTRNPLGYSGEDDDSLPLAVPGED